MTEETKPQPEEKKDRVKSVLEEALEMHAQMKHKAVFVCFLSQDNHAHGISSGENGSEYQLIGAIDLSFTNMKMDMIMRSKFSELGELLSKIADEEFAKTAKIH